MDFNTEYLKDKASLQGVYKPTTDFYNKQMTGLQAEYDPMRTAADQARVNSFRKIENTANSRGMFFSGQPIQNQMEYNYGTYQPAMANIDIAQKNKKTSLEETLLKIGTQIDEQARGSAAGRVKEWQAEQRRIAEEAEAKRRWEADHALRRYNAYSSGGGGGVTMGDAIKDFLGYIGKKFKSAGGAGNVGTGKGKITRQTQDSWANEWFRINGISDNRARQEFWNVYNSSYKRNANPYADWTYARTAQPKYYSGTMVNNPRY